jgi:hypothetical protein
MRPQRIHVSVRTTAPAASVYSLLSDGSTWPDWAPVEKVELEQPGDPPPEGVGAIRRLLRGRVTGRDRIVGSEPGRRFAYESLSGLPVRGYQAEVLLTEAADGTTIEWRASFRPKIVGTGWVLRRGIQRFLADCAEGLARRAAADAGR